METILAWVAAIYLGLTIIIVGVVGGIWGREAAKETTLMITFPFWIPLAIAWALLQMVAESLCGFLWERFLRKPYCYLRERFHKQAVRAS